LGLGRVELPTCKKEVQMNFVPVLGGAPEEKNRSRNTPRGSKPRWERGGCPEPADLVWKEWTLGRRRPKRRRGGKQIKGRGALISGTWKGGNISKPKKGVSGNGKGD